MCALILQLVVATAMCLACCCWLAGAWTGPGSVCLVLLADSFPLIACRQSKDAVLASHRLLRMKSLYSTLVVGGTTLPAGKRSEKKTRQE